MERGGTFIFACAFSANEKKRSCLIFDKKIFCKRDYLFSRVFFFNTAVIVFTVLNGTNNSINIIQNKTEKKRKRKWCGK